MTKVIIASVIMESVTYGKSYLWQKYYVKCNKWQKYYGKWNWASYSYPQCTLYMLYQQFWQLLLFFAKARSKRMWYEKYNM